MTSYEVLIHKKLAKSTKNLTKNHLEKFAKLIDVLRKNPYPWKEFDLKKIEGTKDTYRIRFGTVPDNLLHRLRTKNVTTHD